MQDRILKSHRQIKPAACSADTVEELLKAGIKENTTKSYQAGIRHFQEVWGGALPASDSSVVSYLAAYAGQLKTTTLANRLSAISRWHELQGFYNPTRSPVVSQLMSGIRNKYPPVNKQAGALSIEMLSHLVRWLDMTAARAKSDGDFKTELACRRDKALVLLGFWRAFRGDELCSLQVSDLQINKQKGMIIKLRRSKTDKENRGTEYFVPALAKLCPVTACSDWLEDAGLSEGPVFRAINRRGDVSSKALRTNSLTPLIKGLLDKAGLESDSISSHSLRAGFATWADSQGWTIGMLKQYVGWKSTDNAVRYIRPVFNFGEFGLGSGGSQELELASPPAASLQDLSGGLDD